MTRRASFRQSDVTRLIKAAEAAGKKVVGARPDGTLIFASQDDPAPEWQAPVGQVAPKKKVVLL